MDKGKNISKERKQYLKKIRKEKVLIKIIQFSIVIGLIVLWEVLANNGIIDSFIMSSPSRIVKTFFNLTQNNLIHHVGITCLETIIGFLAGTALRKLYCYTSLVVKATIKSVRAIFGNTKQLA